MEINYKSKLVAYWMRLYHCGKILINTQKMVGDVKEAKEVIMRFQSQAIGATEQMICMLNRNGYSDVAEEIIDLWENKWSKNFQNLMEG